MFTLRKLDLWNFNRKFMYHQKRRLKCLQPCLKRVLKFSEVVKKSVPVFEGMIWYELQEICGNFKIKVNMSKLQENWLSLERTAFFMMSTSWSF